MPQQGENMSVETSGSQPSSLSILSYTDALAARSQDFLLLLGRVLLGWIFVQSGWRKLMDIPAFVATMPRRGLPDVLGWIAPPVEFVGGLMILLGLGTRYAALLILLFTIIATFSSHRYWDFADAAQRQQQHTQFWKNVSMMGGQVLLFITSAGRCSLDWLLARKRG
jgi:putative oxidoreductase